MMTNAELSKAIIEKAIEKGYRPVSWAKNIKVRTVHLSASSQGGEAYWLEFYDKNYSSPFTIEQEIFSHDFAKAFFEGIRLPDFDKTRDKYWRGGHEDAYFVGKPWRYYLQQLVLAEDRLKYLEQFLTK